MLSWYSSGPGWCWTSWLKGQPEGAFGISAVSHYQPHVRSAWAWGTKRFKRCVPAISRFMLKEWPGLIVGAGVTRVEIRNLKDHDIAHRWLKALGSRHEGELLEYGTQGETFELWSLVKKDWQNVLLNAENS